MANDTYSAASGHGIFAGRYQSYPEPIAAGGTVNTLLANVTASGFTLLTTAPVNGAFDRQGHAGSVIDNSRDIVWIFGADTHALAADMDNSVYRFDLSDGLFKKMYDRSAWPGEYRVDGDGILWADAAKTKPWAMHTYTRMWFNQITKEIVIPYDAQHHAYWEEPILENPAVTLLQRKAPYWKYNTSTGLWSYEWNAGADSFNKNNPIFGAVKVPTGWRSINSSSKYLKVSDAGAYSEATVGSLANQQYHSTALYTRGKVWIIMGFDSVDTSRLYSVHPVDSEFAFYGKAVNEFPALSGWTKSNKPACVLPDGNIAFLMQRGASPSYEVGLFILDTINETISYTGHSITGTGAATYDFHMHWSTTHNALVYISQCYGEPVKAYGIKL